jgi:hypothetical protein
MGLIGRGCQNTDGIEYLIGSKRQASVVTVTYRDVT